MADSTISNLTAKATPGTGDLLLIVDVSDTTMAATGTDKKTTVSNLMSQAPVQSVAGKTGAVTLANTDISGLGTASTKAASGTGGTVASVTGTFTVGHMATFSDTAGTIQDGGAVPTGGGTPGGSSGQVQYNASGSFAGASGLSYATSGSLVTATAQAATDVPWTVKGAASQSGNLTAWEDSSGSVVLAINPSGYLYQGTAHLLHTYATGRPGTSVFLGQGAGNLTTTSTYDDNVGIGQNALAGLTTGYQNTAVGGSAGTAISSGHDNTLIGINSGLSITTGYSNVAVGSGCLSNCTTGYYNVAIGLNSLPNLVDGNSVIGIGYGALAGATSISSSVCVGSGYGAATSVSQSVCVGYNNFGSETGGQQLIAVGNSIGRTGTTNQGVIGIGYANWYNVTNYTNSVAIGSQASLNRGGGYCVIIGDNAANQSGAATTGDNCVFIGAHSGSGTANNVANSIALGYNAQVTTSNTCQIGDVGANAVNVQTAGTIATGNAATASRPTTTTVGAMFYDTTLKKPIWWNGTAWTDATGATV